VKHTKEKDSSFVKKGWFSVLLLSKSKQKNRPLFSFLVLLCCCCYRAAFLVGTAISDAITAAAFLVGTALPDAITAAAFLVDTALPAAASV